MPKVFKKWKEFSKNHRYTPEIPEPAPSLSWHGAQIGGLRGFPVFKIKTTVRQVHMSLHLLRSERKDKTCVNIRMAHEDHGRIGFASALACVVGKTNQRPPN